MITIKRKPDFKKDFYEQTAWAQNQVIAGVDEVGRGCLAGPVVAAALILHPGKKSRLIKDSKLLTPEELQKSYAWIIKNSWSSLAVMNHRLIDRVNIYQATLLAMKRASIQLLSTVPLKPNLFVVDAMPLSLNAFEGDIIHFIYGESKSSSIAAASIVAKVTRDRIMRTIAHSIPGYLFENHKGYSTPTHKRYIKELGKSFLHRITFIDHLDSFSDNDEFHEQQSLFAENILNGEISLL
ncbi:MAG: ribonuclease HII [Candidatus Babeliaceae bacterium]